MGLSLAFSLVFWAVPFFLSEKHYKTRILLIPKCQYLFVIFYKNRSNLVTRKIGFINRGVNNERGYGLFGGGFLFRHYSPLGVDFNRTTKPDFFVAY